MLSFHIEMVQTVVSLPEGFEIRGNSIYTIYFIYFWYFETELTVHVIHIIDSKYMNVIYFPNISQMDFAIVFLNHKVNKGSFSYCS